MPFGDNDWLALTQESTLEPEIPICDPHHHMWDRRPERIPYQKYMLDELYADLNSDYHGCDTFGVVPLEVNFLCGNIYGPVVSNGLLRR